MERLERKPVPPIVNDDLALEIGAWLERGKSQLHRRMGETLKEGHKEGHVDTLPPDLRK